jgi:hypothetical protein
MAALTPRRLLASSLVEVTVASVILVLVFGLALASLTRLASSGPQQLQLRGQQLVARAAAETIRRREWQARTWREGVVDLSQEVLPTPESPGLFNLRITATVRGREIARLHQLIYAPAPPTTP